MKQRIKKIFNFELQHLKKLSGNSRRALISFMIYGLAAPVIEVFTSAFLWRKTNGLSYVAAYSIAQYIFIYLTFLLNTRLQKKISIKTLYAFGLILRGVGVVLVMVLGQANIPILVLLGMLAGIGGGLLWSNRNYINLKVTSENNRDYFNSTLSVVDTASGILVPLAAGWFIAFGDKLGLTSSFGYITLGILAFVALAFSAVITGKIDISNPSENFKFLNRVSVSWWLVRVITLANGIFQGISFATLGAIILKIVGNEGTLGTLQSLTALIGAIILYGIGKRISAKDRPRIVAFRAITITIGSLVFLTNLNPFGLSFFVISLAITQPFWVSAIFSIWHSYIEAETQVTKRGANDYLLDIEFFLNAGRIATLIIFIVSSSILD